MIAGWTEGAVAGAALLLAAPLGRAWLTLRRRARLDRVTRDVTARHARLLAVKRNQLVAHDGYGNYELRPWIEHVDYFIGNVVLREARARGIRTEALHRGTPAWSRLRRSLLATLSSRSEAADAVAEVVSGEDYEVLCRGLLQRHGWRVHATPATGDQGADLLAEGRGLRVVIQCKHYSRPVGNKAVQEAHAALAFHAGDRAAVVSNAVFTRSARELARASHVLLLHHDQLADLDEMVSGLGASV